MLTPLLETWSSILWRARAVILRPDRADIPNGSLCPICFLSCEHAWHICDTIGSNGRPGSGTTQLFALRIGYGNRAAAATDRGRKGVSGWAPTTAPKGAASISPRCGHPMRALAGDSGGSRRLFEARIDERASPDAVGYPRMPWAA